MRASQDLPTNHLRATLHHHQLADDECNNSAPHQKPVLLGLLVGRGGGANQQPALIGDEAQEVSQQ